MKIAINSGDLRVALGHAARIASGRNRVPILDTIRMIAADDRVSITASNLDIELTIDIAATVFTDGAACIPLAPLRGFAAAASGDVAIDMDGATARVSSGRSRIALHTLPASDFPDPSGYDDIAMHSFDGAAFCDAMKFTGAAAATNETQYYLCGVHLIPRDGEIEMWGTDGKSAHHTIIAGSTGEAATIPNAAVSLILSITDADANVRFGASGSGWSLVTRDTRARGRVVDGSYPDMARVRGQFGAWADLMEIGADDLSSAISVATCGADDDGDKGLPIVLSASSGSPAVVRGQRGRSGVVHAGRAEVGEAKTDARASLDARYLTRAIKGLPNGRRFIQVCDSAIRITPSQADAAGEMEAIIMGRRASDAEMADV